MTVQRKPSLLVQQRKEGVYNRHESPLICGDLMAPTWSSFHLTRKLQALVYCQGRERGYWHRLVRPTARNGQHPCRLSSKPQQKICWQGKIAVSLHNMRPAKAIWGQTEHANLQHNLQFSQFYLTVSFKFSTSFYIFLFCLFLEYAKCFSLPSLERNKRCICA